MIRIEIKKITDERYLEALRIIEENKNILHHIANTLLENETIDNEELDKIFKIYEKPLPAIQAN
jgi:cell division protease FtsH